ncbi:radical SAM/CxCxxxxC motif protein YfkAB [Salipaludibacillus agaradhaerens]|uniref:radical SAM/CxCxxxxC motif protein YfkAB n=1 Tax=Salipaludibacillus agaradhaerens TaxID=76935 RepID=UPI002150CD30|nr:radical SAM/CxCxxxxC motif protein YfkAB [Salipaludibacillus agaradhaerens]MCR6105853.1 radical SAM/CxCxxxxC motif protein YfkAB [Salipaludibacillus agaradhaerens]MCR6117888.1 radical SAM/CxCxxxxC motif protein YfkAB [Salipaludibacillus agaradhaerens]
MQTEQQALSPSNDPWEAYVDIKEYGKPQLTNIEFTTTNLCNMRCEHCAVGYSLLTKDPEALPLQLFIDKLDEIPHLRAFSITGGEPMMSMKSVKEYVVPLLKYAHDRGARTQINSNLTMPLERYDLITPYLDVLHISHNYGSVDDFVDIGFAVMDRKPMLKQREAYFERMVENSQALSKQGVFISAETMLNRRTLPHLEKIHDQIVAMGCRRHEVHPMYPSNFASDLTIASLEDIRKGIHRLLDHRNKQMWMLFGTLPFYACSHNDEDLSLLNRLYSTENVTVRNDPDGRSRLNVSIFDGSIHVTDFASEGALGSIHHQSLPEAFEKWQRTETAKSLSCHCPAVECLGPNLLVKNAYYSNVDFHEQKAQIFLSR